MPTEQSVMYRLLTDRPFGTPYRIGDLVHELVRGERFVQVHNGHHAGVYSLPLNEGVIEPVIMETPIPTPPTFVANTAIFQESTPIRIGDAIQVVENNVHGSVWQAGHIGIVTNTQPHFMGSGMEYQLDGHTSGWVSSSQEGSGWIRLSGTIQQHDAYGQVTKKDGFKFEVDFSPESIRENVLRAGAPLLRPSDLDLLVKKLYEEEDEFKKAINEFLFDDEYGYVTQIAKEI
jgi:hypothetical protein